MSFNSDSRGESPSAASPIANRHKIIAMQKRMEAANRNSEQQPQQAPVFFFYRL
jgi:hypothetical protein